LPWCTFWCGALALASRIDIIFFLKRTWVFVPLFSLFIAVPALFSSFTPGDPVWVVPGIHAVVTRQGLSTASLFVLRVATSVSLAVLMTLTTRRSALFSAMRSLGIPQVFVMTLSMCYRYVHLFAGIIQDTYRAIKSRTGGYIRSGKGREMVGWNIACLWQRAQRMNEQVYNAMLSRGYTGEEPMRKI
jgi:cobalt ECF transporter T component CbiQ